MKPSEVLKSALELMDGGKKWCQFDLHKDGKCCSNGAMSKVTRFYSVTFYPAQAFLKQAIGGGWVSDWNDSAADFSVIEQGFNKAIELALAEGQ